MAMVSPCPMCSAPVTFGGGMTMQKGGLSLESSAWKYPFSVQKRYHFDSASRGS